MLNALTKKTAWAPSNVIAKPGPLPGTEPGAGSLKLNVDFSNVGTIWRFLKVIIFVVLVSAALTGLLDEPNTVYMGGTSFKVRVADDESERTKGLSGTDNLPTGEGMLFVFDHEGYWPIWMKDMKYPIDIVWLNQDKRVLSVDRNVKPESYPDVYMSYGMAKYAVEVPAGTASGVEVGETAHFKLQ